MRLRWWGILVVIWFAALPGASLPAAIIIGGFDDTRDWRPFSGPDYENIRAILADTANFGPTGIVPTTVGFAADVSSVENPAALTGLDIFVMGETRSDLTATEAAVLADFVREGGCLVVMVDGRGQTPGGTTPTRTGVVAAEAVVSHFGGSSFAAGVTQGDQATAATDGQFVGMGFTTHGPFGNMTFPGDTFGASWHVEIMQGTLGTVVGERLGDPILMEIAPGEISPGSGAVIITGDVLFSDFFVPPGMPVEFPPGSGQFTTFDNDNNAALFANFVAMHIPEPGTLTLAGIALIVLIGWAVRRRQCLNSQAGN